MSMELKLVEVEWEDAWFDREQCAPDGVTKTPIIVTTAGIVVYEDAQVIVVAHEMFEDGTVRGHTLIPKCSVVEIRRKTECAPSA